MSDDYDDDCYVSLTEEERAVVVLKLASGAYNEHFGRIHSEAGWIDCARRNTLTEHDVARLREYGVLP